MEPKRFEALYPDKTRKNEIAELLSYVTSGNSCQLISTPGAGRSNILGLLTHNSPLRNLHLQGKENQYHFVLITFSEIRKKPLIEVTKLLFLELVNSLRDRNMTQPFEHVNALLMESLGFQDELVLFQGLKRAIDYLCAEQNLTIVFLCDRFEEYVSMLTPEFFSQLRILRNKAKYRFAIVLSLNRALEETIEPTLFADYHEFIESRIVYIPLHDDVGLSFRKAYIEKLSGKKVPDALWQEILRLTAGHGKLARLSTEAVLSQSHSDAEDLSMFLLQQKPIHNVLSDIWQSLLPAEQVHLRKRLFDKEYLDEHTRYLENVGLLRGKTICIPLLSAFVDTVVPKEEKQPVISLHPTTNDILLSGTPISEKLTANEDRLLRFFLHNAQRIVARDEIVQSVWKDLKSQAGVTDQALDQLIFRLRRKIETDPNSPKHLLTIKGRGFRFSP